MTYPETIEQEIAVDIIKAVTSITGGCVLFPNHTMGKWINGEFIVKPSCGRKNWSHDWVENVNPEDIDDRFYNQDGTYKYKA